MLPFACGKCLPCLSSRRRLWTHRIMLEGLAHKSSVFVTLTYAPEHLPVGATLVPRDIQLWLKRLRKKVFPVRLRYYLAGEYGEVSGRPHYHVVLFGFQESWRRFVEESWFLGFVQIGTLTKASAEYVSKYVVKGLKKGDDRLCGRYPEFARMSRHPGLGFNSVDVVVAALKKLLVTSPECASVPVVLQHGAVKLPLGRYLRSKIREVLYGDSSEEVKSQELSSYAKEMLALFSGEFFKSENTSCSASMIHSKLNAQRVLTMESKYDIYRQKGRL